MKKIVCIVSAIMIIVQVQAQHEGHTHEHKKDTVKPVTKKASPQKATPTPKATVADTTKPGKAAPADGHADHDHGAPSPAGTTQSATVPAQAMAHGNHEEHSMTHAFSRNLPMTRNGSGTAWLPDNSPMYGYMFHTPKWMYMLHGEAFIRYNSQDVFNNGSRGDAKFDAPNMVMLMGQRMIGAKGLFHFNTMFSLDPITVGGEGYPLLFQTGETYKDQPLVDRQHPHDFISELSVSYAHAFSPKSDVFLYVGYPGEPALGPSAYVHRPSGMFNPDAPLTHHWVDATHITFGVATLGYRVGNWKIEASSFTGREPDENRYDFDKPLFDSWSGRLSFNPTEKWALQASHGFIKEPEAFHPGEDVNRSTVSATFSSRGYGERFTNLTALWGMNKTKGHDGEHGVLLEGTYAAPRYAVYGRYEWVQKSGEELVLDETIFGHDAVFPVHAFTAGVSKGLLTLGQTKFALGTQFTFFNPDKRLASLYGQNPVAGQVYLRIMPRAMGKRDGPFFMPY